MSPAFPSYVPKTLSYRQILLHVVNCLGGKKILKIWKKLFQVLRMNIKTLTLSNELSAQYAEDKAENTEPLSFKLHEPIRSAASRTTTAAE